MKNINTREQLAFILGVQDRTLTYLLYGIGIDKCYRSFSVPKKSGGPRTIHAPDEKLKYVQRKIAEALTAYQESIWKEQNINPKVAHAFLRGKNILTNARIHRKKKYVLNVDLKDYFESFHFGRVEGYFEKNKYFLMDKRVATVMAQLTCYKGLLPQGAPTSPVISNLIFQAVDNRIIRLAKKYRLDYTRYADDLTFSTNDKSFESSKDEFVRRLSDLLKKSGFLINEEKIRFSYYFSRQSVTGITVNEKLNTSRDYIKTTRAMAHALYTKGTFFIRKGQEGTINQLEGRFAFIDQVDLYNNKIDADILHNARRLSLREREYQRFLFFRHFMSCGKPLLVTEGKTDIIHLRTALHRLAGDYPELITDDKYKISFNTVI